MRFDEAYNKQEFTFKRVLTKLKNSSNLLNNANKHIISKVNIFLNLEKYFSFNFYIN